MINKLIAFHLCTVLIIVSCGFFLYPKSTSATITSSSLETQSCNDSTSCVSTSYTPTSDNLILVTVVQRTGISADPTEPTLTGNGLTWVKVNTIVYDATSSSRRRITVFRSLGNGSSGAVTADFGGQSNTHSIIFVDAFANVDTTGTNGSGAVVQSVTNSTTGTSLTVTLAAFGSTNNATFGAFSGDNGFDATLTEGTGFTQLAYLGNGGSVNGITFFRNDNDTSVDISASASQQLGGIGIEIKAPDAGGGGTTPLSDDSKWFLLFE